MPLASNFDLPICYVMFKNNVLNSQCPYCSMLEAFRILLLAVLHISAEAFFIGRLISVRITDDVFRIKNMQVQGKAEENALKWCFKAVI